MVSQAYFCSESSAEEPVHLAANRAGRAQDLRGVATFGPGPLACEVVVPRSALDGVGDAARLHQPAVSATASS